MARRRLPTGLGPELLGKRRSRVAMMLGRRRVVLRSPIQLSQTPVWERVVGVLLQSDVERTDGPIDVADLGQGQTQVNVRLWG